jgi:hypothetical protein
MPKADIEESKVLTTSEALMVVPHLPPGKSQLILVTGRRGFGKTVFVGGSATIEEWEGPEVEGYIERCEPRVLLLDVHGDYGRVRRRVRWQDALADLENTDGPCRRRVVPPVGEGANSVDFGEEFFPACVTRLRDTLLVIEELTNYVSSTVIRGTALETLILQGRHYGIRILATCQRLNRVPGEFHSEATQIVVYNTRRPRDKKILVEWGYEDAIENAPLLGVGECVVLDDLEHE